MVRKVFTDNVQRVEFFVYYIFMTFYCLFTAVNTVFVGGVFLPITVLAGAGAILSTIILIYYFKHITTVPSLLTVYITILILTFLGSAVAESIMFGVRAYVFISKISLYLFCIGTPVKHYVMLNHKLNEYRKERKNG